MGKRYNQDEINNILGDLGNVTQKNYVAPTVKSNVAPAMSVVAQQPRTVQPTVTMNMQQTSSLTQPTVQPTVNKPSTKTKKEDKKKAGILKTALKTAGNIATNMGEGALKKGENVLDTLNDIADAINNPLTYLGNKAAYGKDVAKKALKESEKKQTEFIKRDLVNEMNEATGWNDMKEDWEKDSLVKSDNFGGQLAQGVGAMVPSLLAGRYLGFDPKLSSIKGLSGAQKAKAIAGNVAKTYVPQLPSNAVLGLSSYGSGMEDALNEGASRNKSRLMGLANAGIEQGTEMLTGGVPGLGGKGGIDQFIEPFLDKIPKGYRNDFIRYMYRATGEGLEEKVGTYLDALAQKGVLGKDIDLKEVWKDSNRAFALGTATGAILDSGQLVGDLGSTRAQNIENRKVKEQNVPLETTQTNQETPKVEERQINQEAQNEVKEVGSVPIEQQQKVEKTQPIEKQTTKFVEKNGKYTKQDVLDTAEKIKKSFNNETLTNKKGKKISNFYSNITEKSQFIEPETREKLKTEKDLKFYKDVTNEQSLNEAVEKIGTTPSSQAKALNEFLTKQDQFTATDMAEGWVFLKQYQDAGNYDAMANVAKKMRDMGTKSGQAIQMLNLQARLTPEGMYRFAVNELAEAEQKFNSEKGRTKEEIDRYRDNFQLTPEETDYIKSQMEKVQKMQPGRERDIEVAKINKMLSDKLPHTKGKSLKAWMRLSMLFNPKTQVRNVAGNALITPVNALADVTAGIADKAVSKVTGARTIGGPSLGGAIAYGKGAVKGIKQATQDYRLGIDTKNINQNRFDIGQGKQFNEQHKGPFKDVRNAVAKGLNATNDFLGYLMDAGDRAFYQGSVENSLYNQQKLNNTTEITKEMADIAEMEGLQRTWNDDNQFTKAVLNIRRAINDIGGLMHVKVGDYGLGDLMIPFAKTPANLTKAIVDYSPVGLLNSITEGKNLKRAIATGNYTPQQQHDFAQTLGKATAGSILYALGVALAKAKITSGDSDEDKDLKNFMRYNLGIQPYSIKIGDKSFTYDWAQPIAAPFAITADIEKGIDENMTAPQAIQQFLTTGFNILTEQSFLSGINEVLNDNDGLLHGIEQQVINMPATAVPTLLKQVTDMLDGTKRQTYSKEGMTENAKKYAMSKIPSESKKLSPQVDVLGNEIQKYGGENNAFNVFLNPANTEKGQKSDVSEEIYSLYKATGDKNIIPKKVDYSITIDGKKKVLTTEEMEKWQKASGKYVTDNIRKAINSKDYQRLSDEKKASVINGIVNYSYMKSKSETFGTKISSYYSGPSNAEKKGIPMYDYYISKAKRSD